MSQPSEKRTSPQPPCEDRIGTGPPRARTEVIYVDLGYWAIASVFSPPGAPGGKPGHPALSGHHLPGIAFFFLICLYLTLRLLGVMVWDLGFGIGCTVQGLGYGRVWV